MIIAASILFVLLMITGLIVGILNYKEHLHLISHLNEQDQIIQDMEILNLKFERDLK